MWNIYASYFYMLTLWEEIAMKKKDKHDRFLESEALAFKYNFYKRPIVNEYIELLWNMLIEIGYVGNRKKHKYKPIITHDVDEIKRFPNFKRYLRALVGDIIHRKNN